MKPKLTVGQALIALGVSVAALDRVAPDVSALARDGQTIRVQKVSNRLNVQTTLVSAPEAVLYRPTSALRAGTRQQIQSPRQGRIEVVERIWTLDGRETRREFVSKKLAVSPQPRIIALGARAHVLPENVRHHRRYARAYGYVNSFRAGSPRDRMNTAQSGARFDATTLRPLRRIEVLATGYSAGPAGGAIGNWTATGVRCTYGAIAVDPRVIPLGTKLYIEGYGYGFACDTGGAIKGKKIDLAFDSPRAAFRHGRRRVNVWILG